jgi:hypothetical protein
MTGSVPWLQGAFGLQPGPADAGGGGDVTPGAAGDPAAPAGAPPTPGDAAEGCPVPVVDPTGSDPVGEGFAGGFDVAPAKPPNEEPATGETTLTDRSLEGFAGDSGMSPEQPPMASAATNARVALRNMASSTVEVRARSTRTTRDMTRTRRALKAECS